jgi:predicted DNA-binding WGR domain protein
MRIYMQKPGDTEGPPRFYQILLQKDLLEGWILVREWGNQGASGRVKREHFVSREDAQHALEDARDSQLRRGYQVVFVQGAQI